MAIEDSALRPDVPMKHDDLPAADQDMLTVRAEAVFTDPAMRPAEPHTRNRQA